MSIGGFEYLRYGWQLVRGSRVQGELQISEDRQRHVSHYLGVQRLRILDLGNGYLRPQYIILRSAGHSVVGIDVVNRPSLDVLSKAYKLARAIMRWKLGLCLRTEADNLVCGDVTDMPFLDSSFDLVSSVAAFEHFLHVSKVIKEVARILSPGGLIYARIHLFTCPSGAHNIRVAEVPLHHVPKHVEPWDHLRNRRLPIDVPLNEWRKQQYLKEFSKHLEVLQEYCAMREGEELLTPALEAELSAYSRDELTCGAYVIVARKPC